MPPIFHWTDDKSEAGLTIQRGDPRTPDIQLQLMYLSARHATVWNCSIQLYRPLSEIFDKDFYAPSHILGMKNPHIG